MNGEDLYDILCIDPPWPKKKGGLRSTRPNQTRELDYSTMNIQELFHLIATAIFPMAKQTNTIFLWTIDEFLIESESFMERSGYKRHARLIWDKENGVAPAFSVRYSHEYVTWWYKPLFTQVAENFKGKYTTVIREKSREHSRKPNCFYKMISDCFPNAKKIDIFSRESRTGWDQWGNQTEHFNKG